MRKICSYCHERLPSLESCTCKTIRYGPESVSRIRFGDEEYDWGPEDVPAAVFFREAITMKAVPVRFARCAVN